MIFIPIAFTKGDCQRDSAKAIIMIYVKLCLVTNFPFRSPAKCYVSLDILTKSFLIETEDFGIEKL